MLSLPRANPTRRATLTDVAVKRLPRAPQGKRYDVWDALVPGLSVRVTDRGVKSWTVVGRVHGRPVRATLGAYPDLGVADAREDAREALKAMARGIHPRRLNRASEITLVNDILPDYLKTRKWTKLYRASVDSALKLYVQPALGRIPIEQVTKRDVAAMLAPISEKYPPRAGSVLSHTSAFFAWLLERDVIEANPCTTIRQPQLKSRDRVYSDPELRAIWQAALAIGRPYSQFIRLLLVTAQRRDQVGKMQWTQIDEGRRIWTSATKEKRLHPVPLSDLALSIVAECYKLGPFVMSVSGKRGVTDYSWIAKTIREGKGVPLDFRFHDLRRTAATRMAELGVKPWIVDAVLDHVQGGVSGIYNRYSYLDEMREALALWATRLPTIVSD